MKYVDLHTHTYYSDGTCSPKQNVIDSALLGSEVISITDHDTTQGYVEAKKEAEKWGIEVITGVEITTPKYHILGYNFDIENRSLQSLLEYSREAQLNQVQQRVDKLKSLNIPITLEKVTHYSPNARLGKMNLLKALVLDQQCRDLFPGMSSWEIFDEYMGKGKIASEVDKKYLVQPKEAIDTLHKAGGRVVIAHPFKDMDNPTEELEELVSLGIDGIEIQPNFGTENVFYREYAEKHKIPITYGSDFHGPRFTHRPLLMRGENRIEEFWK
jgi:3',5'-nucleoside bisphosphate phosphatase